MRRAGHGLCRHHGKDAITIYLGNPTLHSHGAMMFNRPLNREYELFEYCNPDAITLSVQVL